MDSVEKNEQGNTPEEKGEVQTGKRLRIKDTRKIDYNRTSSTSRPYQPVYGQTRQSSNYQQRPYPQDDTDDYSQPRPRTNNDDGEGGYQPRRAYDNNQGGGYQQRQSGYNQGYNRPVDNRQSSYQPRRSYDNDQGGGYQQRSYDNNQGGGYQQRQGGYNQGYNRQDGAPQRRSYDNNQGGGYQQRQGGYNNQGGYNQNGNANRGNCQYGGYQQRNQGGRPPQKNSNYRDNQKTTYTKPVKYKEYLLDPSAPIRLNKYLANAGVCSRREADEFIQAGVIKVNGEVISELGTKITRLDKVTFHDQPIQIESKIYIVLNKPKNTVTTSDDPQNRQTVMDLVKNACQERIYPVGRLDRNTTGVLLLTNDGEMAAKLTHPSFKKKKIYHVWLDNEVSVDNMEKLANGIELEDGEIHADAISYANEEDRSQVGIEIHSGKNRVVRRMFEMLGYHVIKLDRVYFAGLTKKNLGRGKWRYLTEQEVNMLRMGAYE
ncbi:MAG: RNA-binding S4 domain-containing protein [Tannerella sp.]|jgi:23S rRNA pseudouridine2605 synthase|nr:RNA-binding S4 domain-containing protein [Tannerella sp.]